MLIIRVQILGEPGTGGSSTPSMVGAVKKWQKSDPQNSLETWRKLSESNSALELHLNALSGYAEKYGDAYKCVISRCSVLTSEKVNLQSTVANFLGKCTFNREIPLFLPKLLFFDLYRMLWLSSSNVTFLSTGLLV